MIEIPGYSIEKQLGRGGMARVYLARHIGLDRLVAIKVLSKDLDHDSSFSDRFMREARIVASLTHPHIITVHDVGVHNEYHYIAMEYLPGETLDDKIKKKLPLAQALSITKQIASALDFAHKKGIVHRDVKPENILFREDGSAVLTDFGIARAAKSETRMTATGTVIGTPHYMSPEQAQGLEIGPWSDLYSLGIVVYEMLSGEVPFDADSTIAVVFKHINEPVPELAEEHAACQPLVNTLLAKEPDARYQSGREVIADIEALERGETPANATLIFKQTMLGQTAINPAASTQQTETGRPPEQKKTGAIALIAGVFLLVVAGAGYYFYQQQQAISPLAVTTPAAAQQAEQLKQAQDKQAEEKLRQQALREEALRKEQEQQLAQEKAAREKAAQEKAALEKAAQEKAAQEKAAREKVAQLKAAQESASKRRQEEETQRLLQEKARAEAEARKARAELQALRNKQREQQKLAAKTTTVKKTSAPPPEPVKTSGTSTAATAHKKGLLAGWLSEDDTSKEYINDLLTAGDNALARDRLASAKANYTKVLQAEPNNARAKAGLEKVALLSKEEPKRKTQKYIEDLLKAADNALQNDRLSSAASNYEKVIKVQPENKSAYKGINRVFYRRLQLAKEEALDDDFDDAWDHIKAAEKLKPGNEDLTAMKNEIRAIYKKRQ